MDKGVASDEARAATASQPSQQAVSGIAGIANAGKTAIVCEQCGTVAYKASGGVNRSRAKGAPLFCSRACSGLRRRIDRSIDEKRALKAEYDRQRRAALADTLREKKRAAYYERLARDPDGLRAAQKALRQRRRQHHLEYCRRPEYRAKKRAYDREHRAGKFYGPFAEAFLVLQDLENEIASRATRTEIYRENGTLNKTQTRKRAYEKAIGC